MERQVKEEKKALDTIIRVVLADDHAIVRAGIRQFLEQADDIRVIAEASDGAMAIDMIKRLSPDIAVLDIQMPKVTGIDVAREIRAKRLSVGLLILTTYDDDPYISALLKTGVNGYILKTASPGEIIAAVRDVAGGKPVLGATILPKVLISIAHPDMRPAPEAITDREKEILTLVAKGLTNKVVGACLKISDRTVQGHISRIFQKLQVSSRTEAMMKGVSLGLIQFPSETEFDPSEFSI